MTAALTYSAPTQHHSSNSSIPYAQEMLHVARHGYSFQTREVLQRIVMGEQQRIKEEQMLWRVGGTIFGMCFGIGDGLQLTDLFIGMAGSAIGSLAHETMSHEDRQFLERCQSLWLVGQNSPIELAQRLGPARSRILLHDPSWEAPLVFNHHQGHRGDHLVPLGNAGNLATGFADTQSLEVLQRHFDRDDLQTLETQLYPIASHAVAVDRVEPISQVDALELDADAASFMAESRPVRINTSNGATVGYQVPIPAQSDF
jgi:hypothetical protein